MDVLDSIYHVIKMEIELKKGKYLNNEEKEIVKDTTKKVLEYIGKHILSLRGKNND
jgi:hypothetical protein